MILPKSADSIAQTVIGCAPSTAAFPKLRVLSTVYLDRFAWAPFEQAELDLRVWARLQRR